MVPGNFQNNTINYLNEKVFVDTVRIFVLEFCGFPCFLYVGRGHMLLRMMIRQIKVSSDRFRCVFVVSFQISLRWPIHVINPVDKIIYSCNIPTDAATQFLYKLTPFKLLYCQHGRFRLPLRMVEI